MDTLSNVESETRRSESFAHTGAPDNFSSYRDAPPGLLQKRLLDDGDKEEARTVKKKEKKKRGKGKRRKKKREGRGGGGGKKSGVLFSTVKTVATQAAGMETAHDLLVNVGIDFQLLAFQKR